MKIVQLTDCHIGEEGEDTRGVDVRRNFRACLREIRQLGADRLVLTGDLCFSVGSTSVYHWIRRELELVGLSCEFIPGNHDDPLLLARTFALDDDLQPEGLYFSRIWNGRRVLFLDTSSRRIGPGQFNWLAEQLQKAGEEVLIFMHHPPLLSGVPYMDDNHALQDRAPLLNVLTTVGLPVHIFCGHYHVDKVIRYNNLLVHITPSGFFQIDQYRGDFGIEHHRPGFRVITWEPGLLMTTVRYLEVGNKKIDG